MAQVLSQDEVDALLNAVNDGDDDGGGSSDSGGFGGGGSDDMDYDENIQPYDLTNQDRVIRGRMPILEIIYERFIRSFRVSLSNSLRKISTISMISTDFFISATSADMDHIQPANGINAIVKKSFSLSHKPLSMLASLMCYSLD